MIKLYNIYENLILESKLLVENVSGQQITDAMDKPYRIKIKYQGEKEQTPSVRYIDVYVYGLSKAGNPVIRVFQTFGQTTSEAPQWKLLRLDRIISWEPTKQHVGYKPISDYDSSIIPFNKSGDRSMSTIYKIKNFQNTNYGNNTSTDRQKQTNGNVEGSQSGNGESGGR